MTWQTVYCSWGVIGRLGRLSRSCSTQAGVATGIWMWMVVPWRQVSSYLTSRRCAVAAVRGMGVFDGYRHSVSAKGHALVMRYSQTVKTQFGPLRPDALICVASTSDT